MAKIIKINKFSERKKKWQHFKLKLRSFSFKLSIFLNLLCGYYFLDKYGYLTTIIEQVASIMESLIKQLPL